MGAGRARARAGVSLARSALSAVASGTRTSPLNTLHHGRSKGPSPPSCGFGASTDRHCSTSCASKSSTSPLRSPSLKRNLNKSAGWPSRSRNGSLTVAGSQATTTPDDMRSSLPRSPCARTVSRPTNEWPPARQPSPKSSGKATVAAKDAQRGGEEAGFEARQVVGVAVGSNAARRGDAWFGLLRFRRRTSSSFFF